jgi:hypothetical protein
MYATSSVHASTMQLKRILELQNFHTKFLENESLAQKLKYGDTFIADFMSLLVPYGMKAN